YTTIQSFAGAKPVFIAETASSEHGGSKAAWITDMLTTQIPSVYTKIKAVMWFNSTSGGDDPIESSSTAMQAFQRGIASPTYASNTFSNLIGNSIQPLP